MSTAAEQIAGWEAAGLLDAATADRLRAAERASDTDAAPDTVGAEPVRSAASRLFGPGVMISEVFGYLGAAFLLGAWGSFMGSVASGSNDSNTVVGLLGLVAAGVLVALALVLRRGDERRSRAAGVALLAALGFVSASSVALIGDSMGWATVSVMVSVVVVLAAVVFRLIHPAVLTQVGLLAGLTGLAASSLLLVQDTFFRTEYSDATGLPVPGGPDPILLVLGSAAWWLLVAVGMGLLGLAEARNAGRPDDPTAANRAAVTRFWAGLVAVIGLATAVSRTGPTGDDSFGRILEPIVGILAMLILSAVLVERAFRRDATSYIYAAALGLIVALTDLNLSYLPDSNALALLVEGVILLGVGVGADRLRRRIGGEGTMPPDEAPATVEVAAAADGG